MPLSTQTTFKLNTGAEIPAVGLGTWQSKPGEVRAAVRAAIEAGYKHIDGAWIYGNEKEIGDELQDLFKEGKIKREELFYTSKLWNTFHKPADVARGVEESLKNTQLGYLDLLLIHWPLAWKSGEDKFPKEGDKWLFEEGVKFIDTWRELEKIVESGKVKAIGLSNFNAAQISELLKDAKIKPAVLQVELHPWLPQPALIRFLHENQIIPTAYSPFATGRGVLEDPTILEVAKKVNKPAANVILSWLVSKGIQVIPKSVTPERIKANFEIFDLPAEEIKKIDSITKRVRNGNLGNIFAEGDYADN
ncbi:hypothetical protein HK097_008746 [Rhizophlyctis rosea]|uniref:NADP-dependent oxidoreductase domain-containing protein n=1 Tax=Rhizophlyctis rosea TaxID=64517 RepID=A0AAD5SC16_9FUNG|nr:hypothetical protein HK097_008746 [Rhizophlyctis rosea]